jgi:hypothetical protein
MCFKTYLFFGGKIKLTLAFLRVNFVNGLIIKKLTLR